MKDVAYLSNCQIDGIGLLGDVVNMLKGTAKLHLQMPAAHANSHQDFRHVQSAGYEPKHCDGVHVGELISIEELDPERVPHISLLEGCKQPSWGQRGN